jgi:hypothetical protein
MSDGKAQQASRFRSMQVTLFAFSLIFFGVIAYGYFNLFLGGGLFFAFCGAALLAVLAWFLARVIGTDPSGMKRHAFLFVPLFIISAAGVFNSLMLTAEGGRILADAANDGQAQFTRLQQAAEGGLAASGAAARIDRVRSLSESLYSEIKNPLNCGQGPEAARIIGDLRRELPGFTPLSNPARDCARNDEIVSDYRTRIEGLIARAPWNNPDLVAVMTQSSRAREELGALRAATMAGYNPADLKTVQNALEARDAQYRELRFRASRHIDASSLPEGLHISEAQNLGNAFKVLGLFFERLDQASTYVYLAVALGFDVLMVLLFQMVTANQIRRRASHHTLAGAL